MDYALLYQFFFSDPDQTDIFGRKIVNCGLNTFANGAHHVNILIVSKASEWDTIGFT